MKTRMMMPVTHDVLEQMEHMRAQFKNMFERIEDASEEELAELNHTMEEYENMMSMYDFFDKVFSENGRKGLKDVAGRILVPALYYDFSETYRYDTYRGFPVGAKNEDGKYGLVSTDGLGTPVTDFEYDSMGMLPYSSMYAVGKDGKFGVLRIDGKVVAPCELDKFYEPENDIYVVEAGGKSGIITSWGKYIAPVYDRIEEKDELVYVCLKGIWGYVDEDGNFIGENEKSRLQKAALLNYRSE